MAFGLSTAHYLFKCFDGGHFHLVKPEDALLELWLPAIVIPGRMIWTIIIHHLEKLAGEDNEDS